MKKFNLAALAVLDLLMLASCSKDNKGIVIEKTEDLLSDAPSAPEGYEYLEGGGKLAQRGDGIQKLTIR